MGMTGLCLEGRKGLKYYTLVGRGDWHVKKMEMATLVGRLEFIHMGHPCEEYNGEGYLLKIDFGKGVVRLDSLVGRLG